VTARSTKQLTRTLGPAAVVSIERGSDLVGRVISNYQLVSVLGRGGAGTVYLAERADHQFSGKVAVKVIDRATTLDLGLRFRVERQILASLNHPNIARLLDAGETDDGQPYLIMEYLEGQPLDQYCDEKRLGLAARLELFAQVCAAVQYAHQNLIIHRDIKPANILVTADGTPKLLDFGIAKLLHARDLGKTAELTRMNDRVLTPEYASPEQITGGAVTTATDVYSLGVVLYRLLSGLRPYDLPEASSQLELERAICVVDVPRPSLAVHRLMQTDNPGDVGIAQLAAIRRLTPERLKRDLIGDLDSIVMRALRKEPERRYSSVERLIADVRHYLADEPVQARQGNWLYYTQRFVRRHTMGVAAAIAFFAFLVAVSVVMSIQRQNIAAALEQAMLDRERAENVSQFMMKVFSAADPFVNFGREPTARVLLDQAARNIQNDLDQQPDVRARLLETIGRSYRRMRELDSAATYLSEALRLKRAAGADPLDLGGLLTELASARREQGYLEESDRYLAEAQQALLQSRGDRSEAHAVLLMDLSALENLRGRTREALGYAHQALELMQGLKGAAHPDVGAVLVDMANIMLWADDLEGAERVAREAVAIFEKVPDNQPNRVMADYRLGDILFYQGQTAEAAALFERALSAQRRIFGNNSIIADTLASLAQVRLVQGKVEQAEKVASEALEIHAASESADYLKIGYLQTLLATVWMRANKPDQAARLLQKTVTLLADRAPTDHQYTASAEHYLGEALLAQGRAKEAEEVLTKAMGRWERSGAPAWRSARSESALGQALHKLHRTHEAELHLVESFRVLQADAGADTEARRIARERVMRFYTERGERLKLDALLREAVEDAPNKVPTASG
jgi:serine/threonine protein kinase/predicted negative regulator of RcsB-dependent stress response